MNIIPLINEITNSFNENFKVNLTPLNLESKLRDIGDLFTLKLYESFLNYFDKQFKNDPWLISLSSSDKDLNSRKGNIIVAEKLDVLDNEHSRDCRVFINNQASIENPNIRGNSDSMSYMAAEELKKHGRGGRD